MATRTTTHLYAPVAAEAHGKLSHTLLRALGALPAEERAASAPPGAGAAPSTPAAPRKEATLAIPGDLCVCQCRCGPKSARVGAGRVRAPQGRSSGRALAGRGDAAGDAMLRVSSAGNPGPRGVIDVPPIPCPAHPPHAPEVRTPSSTRTCHRGRPSTTPLLLFFQSANEQRPHAPCRGPSR